MHDDKSDYSKNKKLGIRLIWQLGKDGTFLRTIGGILCIYFGIWFAMIGVILTFIFPSKMHKLLNAMDPIISEWWNTIGFCGQLLTLIWGILTVCIIYTYPNWIFAAISSKLIYALGNVCAAKLGSEIAILNIKRTKRTGLGYSNRFR